jgi:hypothetical protein
MVDNKVIRNYITPNTVEWLGLLYRQKLKLYTLVTVCTSRGCKYQMA